MEGMVAQCGAERKICLLRRWEGGEERTKRVVPTVGVFTALSDAFEDKEDELSARASGAVDGGLPLDVFGGLKGRP